MNPTMKHLSLIAICFLMCLHGLSAQTNGSVRLATIKPGKDKTLPYSVGFMASCGSTDDSYYANNTSLFLEGTSVKAGAYIKLTLHEGSTTRASAIGSISYKACFINDIDSFVDRRYSISASYISANVSVGGTVIDLTGFRIGVGADLLTGFRGSPYSYMFDSINKECLNRVIPYLTIGFSFGETCHTEFEIPLNTGMINLDRYAYYNRARLTYHRMPTIGFSFYFRIFGSSHK